jgi:hypothetical protein
VLQGSFGQDGLGLSLGFPHASHHSAGAAAAEEESPPLDLRPDTPNPLRHLDQLQHLARLRIDPTDGDAACASDLFSRAKGSGPPQEQPCSGEIAKLGHGNAAQLQCRRVIAQRDTIQDAKGINRCQGAGACCD